MLVLKQFHTDVVLEQCSNFVPCQPLQPRPVDHNQSDDSLKHKQNIKYQKHPTDDNQSDDSLKHKQNIKYQKHPTDDNQSDDSLKHKQNIKYQKHPTDDNQSDDSLKHKRGITAPNIQQTIIASAQLEVPK